MRFKWQKRQENHFFYFLHFLAVFTAIFVVMTMIIFQIILSGTYSSVDKALLSATKDTAFFVRKSLSVAAIEKESGQELPISFRLNGQLVANTDVLIHDELGQLLNPVATFSSLQYMVFRPTDLNDIVMRKVKNVSGQEEVYRMITVRVADSVFPEAAYLSVAINTTQLEETTHRNVTVISSVMFMFWLISMGASLYLARWSRKPIVENYEKQKAFVENASHELRTPIAVLQNRLELLFRKPDSTIMDNSENIASSLEEVRHMKTLTSNLLDLARRDDGFVITPKELSGQFFQDLFTSYSLIAEEHGKTFHFVNQITGSIYSDPVLLRQLTTILFDNAVKYTGDDGDISFTVTLVDKQLRLTVADNGFGIEDAEKEAIFERFYRVDKARTRQKGGFGLGLALAKQIVEALNGSISVRDNLPKGTIFDLKIRVL